MRVDALQKYRNQLLSAFNAEQLQYLKYDSWSGLLTETDRLYATMFHDWDVLQKDCSDLAEAVQTLEWTVAPYVADGEKPNAKAQEVAKTVTDALWKRTPHAPGTYSHSFPQLINALVHALFRGYNVHEIEWVNSDGLVYPAAFHQLPAQFMRWEDRAGQVDRLLFIPDGETETPRPFPKNKYLVALNTSGPDHPLFNAMYYSLIAWYGAYKFGLGWFMEYCQKYGMPKLVFHYASESDRRQLEKDLAEERVLNNILLKGDREVDIANAPASGASLPQRELLTLAESQCHKLILGQTLTSDTSQHGGSLAQAKVHAGVQAEVVKKRADFVADVLNSQLIPAIVLLNYGTLDVPMPELRYKIPQEGVTLERVQVVKTALEIKGMRLKKSEVYEFTGFAQPADGDEVFEAASAEGDMAGLAGRLGKGKPQDDTDPDDDPNKPKKKAPAPKGSEDVEPVSAAKTDAPTDPAQEWLAPIKQKFLEARKAGASMADMRKMLLTMHPNTKALAKAFANNILAGFAGESEEVEAANPYGCNQYGEGWVRPHNGMQTLRRRKDATPSPDTSEIDKIKIDDNDDSPEAMEKRKHKFDLHKQFAEEMEKRLQEWLNRRGESVKAAAGTEDDKRPFPVQMPDGSMCHTYGCERHKGADELAIKQADKKLDELMRQAKEAFEKGQMTKLQKIMEEHAVWRSYAEKVMALLGIGKNKNIGHAKTREEALEHTKSLLSPKYRDKGLAVFSDMVTTEQINEFNAALADVVNKYPTDYLMQLGSYEDDDDATGAHANEFILELNHNKGKWGIFNFHNWKPYSLERQRESGGYKRHNVGASENGITIQSVVYHEYGHVIHERIRKIAKYSEKWLNTQWEESLSELEKASAIAQKTLKNALRKAKKNGDILNISEYARTNNQEFFAECFAARELGEDLPDYINAALDIVIDCAKIKS